MDKKINLTIDVSMKKNKLIEIDYNNDDIISIYGFNNDDVTMIYLGDILTIKSSYDEIMLIYDEYENATDNITTEITKELIINLHDVFNISIF